MRKNVRLRWSCTDSISCRNITMLRCFWRGMNRIDRKDSLFVWWTIPLYCQITINSLLESVDGVDIWTTLERKGWWRPVEVRVEYDGNRKVEQIEQRWVLLWFSKVQFEHVHVLDDISAFDVNVLLFTYPISFRESPLASDDFLGVEYVNEVSLECRIIVSSSSIVRKRSSGIYTTNTNIYVHSSLNIIYIIIHLWKPW